MSDRSLTATASIESRRTCRKHCITGHNDAIAMIAYTPDELRVTVLMTYRSENPSCELQTAQLDKCCYVTVSVIYNDI
jgi:hypothetical protein